MKLTIFFLVLFCFIVNCRHLILPLRTRFDNPRSYLPSVLDRPSRRAPPPPNFKKTFDKLYNAFIYHEYEKISDIMDEFHFDLKNQEFPKRMEKALWKDYDLLCDYVMVVQCNPDGPYGLPREFSSIIKARLRKCKPETE